MDRRTFSSVLDEATRQLESDVRTLKNQQAAITVNLKELEGKRNGLSGEIIELEKKKATIIKETQDEKENILKSAQEKTARVNLKDIEVSSKLSELNEKTEVANNLIKSNQGLQKNLNLREDDIKNKSVKLNKLIGIIGETLKDL